VFDFGRNACSGFELNLLVLLGGYDSALSYSFAESLAKDPRVNQKEDELEKKPFLCFHVQQAIVTVKGHAGGV